MKDGETGFAFFPSPVGSVQTGDMGRGVRGERVRRVNPHPRPFSQREKGEESKKETGSN